IVSPEVPARSSKEGRPRSQNQDKQRIMLARDGGEWCCVLTKVHEGRQRISA
ncbi:hypothetical protein PF005_g28319, partial [Phytophthora fragariae]